MGKKIETNAPKGNHGKNRSKNKRSERFRHGCFTCIHFFTYLHKETSKPRHAFITLKPTHLLGRLSLGLGAARGPSLFTAACGVSGGIMQTLSCGRWLIPDGTRAPYSGRVESWPRDLWGSPRRAVNSKEETQGMYAVVGKDKR